jgi:hypothetical protein
MGQDSYRGNFTLFFSNAAGPRQAQRFYGRIENFYAGSPYSASEGDTEPRP